MQNYCTQSFLVYLIAYSTLKKKAAQHLSRPLLHVCCFFNLPLPLPFPLPLLFSSQRSRCPHLPSMLFTLLCCSLLLQAWWGPQGCLGQPWASCLDLSVPASGSILALRISVRVSASNVCRNLTRYEAHSQFTAPKRGALQRVFLPQIWCYFYFSICSAIVWLW